jgi:hypothetical protein
MSTANNDAGKGARVTVADASRQWVWLLPLLGLLLAYGPVLDGPLFFDDEPNLLDNTLLQLSGSTFDEWRIAVVSNDSGILHRPVSMFTFALNYFFAGEFSASSLKAVNLLLHIANGALLYCLALGVLKTPAMAATHGFSRDERRALALGAAALWLLHPIHVSTVLYAVQRMAQLSTLFTFAGLVLFLRYRLRWAQRGAGAGEVVAAGLWLLILLVLSVLSKENGALLAWLLFVIEFALFRGLWGGVERRLLSHIALILLLAPALVIALVALYFPDSLPGTYYSRDFDLAERLMTQGRALWLYLQWMAVPDITQMGFFHDDIAISRSLWAPQTTALALAAWFLVIVACLFWRHRFALVSFAFLFYLVGHAMESTVLPLELIFEHRNYLPSSGFAIAVPVAVLRLCKRAETLRFLPVICGICLLLTVLLVIRSQAWTDTHTLARFNAVNHPNSPRANFYYALALTEEFKQAKAANEGAEYEAALAVAARSHYMRMYELAPSDMAGVIMLYQFDTLYFPAAAKANDWLGVLEALAHERRLTASDKGALGSLVSFARRSLDADAQARVANIVAILLQRYPHREALAEQLYLLRLAGGGDKTEMLPLLQRAAQLNPGNSRAVSHLVGYHATDDTPAAIEALREWIRRDTLRRDLPIIKELLGQ